jgi:hypothetical protein
VSIAWGNDLGVLFKRRPSTFFVDAEKCLETATRIDKMPEFIS